jgi:thiamine biosynthesis protein ThiI
MPEYCGVISDKPATKSEEFDILKEEENIDEQIISDAINSRKIEKMSDLLKEDL